MEAFDFLYEYSATSRISFVSISISLDTFTSQSLLLQPFIMHTLTLNHSWTNITKTRDTSMIPQGIHDAYRIVTIINY